MCNRVDCTFTNKLSPLPSCDHFVELTTASPSSRSGLSSITTGMMGRW